MFERDECLQCMAQVLNPVGRKVVAFPGLVK